MTHHEIHTSMSCSGNGSRQRTRPSRFASRRGQSLLEVLIALLVFVLIFVQVFLLNLLSRRLTQQANAQATAYLTAERQMEAIRAEPWADRVTSKSISFTVAENVNAALFDTHTDRQMRGKYTVTTVSDTLQQASVCVNWPSFTASGKTSEVCMDTYISKESTP